MKVEQVRLSEATLDQDGKVSTKAGDKVKDFFQASPEEKEAKKERGKVFRTASKVVNKVATAGANVTGAVSNIASNVAPDSKITALIKLIDSIVSTSKKLSDAVEAGGDAKSVFTDAIDEIKQAASNKIDTHKTEKAIEKIDDDDIGRAPNMIFNGLDALGKRCKSSKSDIIKKFGNFFFDWSDNLKKSLRDADWYDQMEQIGQETADDTKSQSNSASANTENKNVATNTNKPNTNSTISKDNQPKKNTNVNNSNPKQQQANNVNTGNPTVKEELEESNEFNFDGVSDEELLEVFNKYNLNENLDKFEDDQFGESLEQIFIN